MSGNDHITYVIPGARELDQLSSMFYPLARYAILESPCREGVIIPAEKGVLAPLAAPHLGLAIGARNMGRPRKWLGDTQAERTRAYKRDLYRRQHEGEPDRRPKSKYPGETPEERDRARKADWSARHIEEVRAYQSEYRKRPEAQELARARAARYRRSMTPLDYRLKNLRNKYGLTPEQYNAMMAVQDGKCAICRQKFDLLCMPAVDHCHSSKKVRGLLCGFCNRMIGMANDKPERLAAAISYLELPPPDLPEPALHAPGSLFPHGKRRALREIQLRTRYGLTPYGYDYLLLLQQGACRICYKPFGNEYGHIDHDHISGRVRGLLCRLCNVMLGMSRENLANLRAGIAYLEAHE